MKNFIAAARKAKNYDGLKTLVARLPEDSGVRATVQKMLDAINNIKSGKESTFNKAKDRFISQIDNHDMLQAIGIDIEAPKQTEKKVVRNGGSRGRGRGNNEAEADTGSGEAIDLLFEVKTNGLVELMEHVADNIKADDTVKGYCAGMNGNFAKVADRMIGSVKNQINNQGTGLTEDEQTIVDLIDGLGDGAALKAIVSEEKLAELQNKVNATPPETIMVDGGTYMFIYNCRIIASELVNAYGGGEWGNLSVPEPAKA